MLVISADPYQSPMTVLYQRLTVVVTDLLLFYAILQSATRTSPASETQRCESTPHLTLPLFLVALCVQIRANSCELE